MENDKELQRAVEVLKSGGIVIFPTDTVWGIGVRADDAEAVKKFYKIKRREEGKPSQVLVADIEQAEKLGQFSDKANELVQKYWPGALTIVVSGKNGGTVGLRMPDHELSRELCRRVGPIMAGSANFAGNTPPMRKGGLDPELIELVDLVIDGECGGQESSTVVDTTKKLWEILRQGPVQLNLR